MFSSYLNFAYSWFYLDVEAKQIRKHNWEILFLFLPKMNSYYQFKSSLHIIQILLGQIGMNIFKKNWHYSIKSYAILLFYICIDVCFVYNIFYGKNQDIRSNSMAFSLAFCTVSWQIVSFKLNKTKTWLFYRFLI